MKNNIIWIIGIIIALFVIFNSGILKQFGLFSISPCDNEHGLVADAWTDEYAKSSVQTTSFLKVKGDSTRHRALSYLKFKLSQQLIDSVKSGVKIDSASLDIFQGYSARSLDLTIYDASSTWSEISLTWNNAPANKDILATSSKVYVTTENRRKVISLNPTYIENQIKSGETYLTLVLDGGTSSGGEIRFGSKEYGAIAYSCSLGGSSSENSAVLNIGYVPPECTYQQSKCDGVIWYTCLNGKWHEEGKTPGMCNYYSQPLQLGKNQLIAMETFSGGSTISKTSTRYPVIVWGGSLLPAIIIDSIRNQVSINPLLYKDLDTGKVFQVPTTQTWSLFYVIENNYQLPTICDIIDVKTNQCAKINPGIVTVCSEGQFDPSLGLCVIQPESRIICPSGGRYDTSQKVCIFNPPTQFLCPQDGKAWIYNINTQKCEYSPAVAYNCPTGTYDSASGKCQVYPTKQINCPSSYAYDLATDKCVKYPDTRTICPIGANYNTATDKCEYKPASDYVCQTGFIYNSATGNCELKPAEKIVCGIGTYDTITKQCIYNPATTPVCSKGVLTNIGNGNYACIYTPESIEKCPTGSTYNVNTQKCEYYPSSTHVCQTGFTYNSATGYCEVQSQIVCVQGTYDSSKNACVYTPNMQYLCINGELTYENNNPTCKITPESSIICPSGFTYNAETEKCESYPDYWNTGVTPSITVTGIWGSLSANMKIVVVVIGVILLLLLISGGRRR